MSRIAGQLLLLASCILACRPVADEPPSALPLIRTPARAPSEKLAPGLKRAVESRDPGARVGVLVDLTMQLDLDALGRELAARRAGRLERRQTVVEALRIVAHETQARLEPVLERLRRRGDIESFHGFSIVNRLYVVATARGVETLAAREEVSAIVEETWDAVSALAAPDAVLPPAQGESWAIAALGAPRVWGQDLSGSGIVVGIIDAGASAAHEQLRDNYRGGDRAWYDPVGETAAPTDAVSGHGTSMLSVAVGQNVAGKTLGVAPDAEWIACLGLPEGRFSNVAFTACADWMLNVGQPDVLLNAWVLRDPGCDTSLARIVNGWRVAEIVPVFAAGNYGPAPASDRSPANYGGLYPGDRAALSVGGSTTSGVVSEQSSRGPSSCDGAVFPTLVAPAERIMAAFPLSTSTYVLTQGTSVAAALLAGGAALLLQRFPDATVFEVEDALRLGAIDVGPPGPDNTYGFGQIYLPAALDSLGELLPRNEARKRTSEPNTQR